MENISLLNSQIILTGILEIGDFKYPYVIGILTFYVVVTILCSINLYVICLEESLYQPMFIFFSNLLLNEIYGGTVFVPKLLIDVLGGRYLISVVECLAQGFFMQGVPCIELLTFTTMAYDRYLAIGHALRYPILMTNKIALNIILVIYIYIIIGIGIGVILASRQRLCGVKINSMFCETISLNHLSCNSNTYGFTYDVTMLVGCLVIVLYCYIMTFVACFSISRDASKKAIHTLITHIISFSTYLSSFVFIMFRYRFEEGAQTVTSHVLSSMPGTVSYFMNPLIYGIRTEALRNKIIQRLHINVKKKTDAGKKNTK
ncbi:olfactory receptor 8A1-like [Dendropsophus ebraccatus]|uniref:olfactory receptor 8A1-like n=1 Tax=Dendropsophus ebraccatus TaxID=150705 RepID=UPI003831541B